jgi:exodeoxyribonuclease-3
MTLKIASWNVNSVRARLDRLQAGLADERPDVVCLQETKVRDEAFPAEALQDVGYESVVFGQKSYNGVAILSRDTAHEVARGFGDGQDDLGSRFLVAELRGILVASVYAPNGREVGTEQFAQKLEWLRRLRAYLEREAFSDHELVLCGDWNVTPEDRDVWDPERLRGTIHCHPDERAALQQVLDWGLQDTFRLHEPAAGHHSWWDYRRLAFPKGRGLRIDLILATAPLARRCTAAGILREARKGKGASDHAPVWAEFADPS